MGVECVRRLVWACLKAILLMAFESGVGKSECIQCWWASLRDGDVSRFCEFCFVFGSWSFGEDGGCKSGDGGGGLSGIGGAAGGGGRV